MTTGDDALQARDDPGGQTVDAFHRGDFHLVQPVRGHRSGMDAMVLAAAVPSTVVGEVADFGAGAGAAGLAVASRCRQTRVTLIERDPRMAAFARSSIAHPLNTALAGRARVIEADVSLTGVARRAAGLGDAQFDFVIMNPPFNRSADRASPDPDRRDAHVMPEAMIGGWIRTAGAVTRPRGGLAIIARPQSLAEILAAFEGRYGAARILPIQPRGDSAAIRIVVRAVRASRAPLSLCAPLVMHGDAGNGFSARADAIGNGRASLFGD